MKTPVLLHLHSGFDLGGKEARAVALMNAAGERARHIVVSGMAGAMSAREAVAPGIAVDYPGAAFPALTGRPSLARYRALALAMQGADLVLTYNWGAMDAVVAHRLATATPGGRQTMPPLVHHEDGFNADEHERRKPGRTRARRWLLPTARHVVVPSHTLERIARGEWRLAPPRLLRIANGLPLARYAEEPVPPPHPALAPVPGTVLVGTVAGLRPVKQLDHLIRAVALTPPRVRLVVVGEGPERARLEACAGAHGVADRVAFTGFLAEPARWIGHLDVLALSSLSEQQPIAVIEAMAAGLPVAAYQVGDISEMVATANRPFVTSPVPEALGAALGRLAGDADLRRALGRANQSAAQAFDERRMRAAYASAYGMPGLFEGGAR